MTDSIISPAPDPQNDRASVEYPDLKALREAKGLSLRDIYERTRISVFNLDAIENRQYHLLPAPVYARTFIKNYALAVGADSKILLGSYEQYLQSLNDHRQQEKETGKTRRKIKVHYKRVIWLLSATMAVIVIIFIMSHYDQPSPEIVPSQPAVPIQKAPDKKPVEIIPPVAPTPPQALTGKEETDGTKNIPTIPQPRKEFQPGVAITPADKSPAKIVQPEMPKAAAGKNYHLMLEAKERVWLKVRGDQNQPEQMTLKAGDKLERFASESFSIDIGNAGGIDIIFQGKSMGSIGKPGQVVHLRLP
jgi:cytoskeleton protein RodZ